MSDNDNTTEVAKVETENQESELLKSIKEDPTRAEETLIKLRAENKDKKERYRAVEEELLQFKEAKELAKTKDLEEQGKFKELLDDQALKNKDLLSQIDELNQVKTKYDSLEADQKELLVEELTGLDKATVELIDESTMSTTAKIAKARYFKDLANVSNKTNPASSRTGGTEINKPNLTTLGRQRVDVSYLRS